MAQIKSVTSPILKTYLSKLDANDAPGQIRNLSLSLFTRDQTIDAETYFKIETLVHGPWVYVQVLQGENLNGENIDFVAQNNSDWGIKGKLFWETIGGSFEFTNNSSSGDSLDLTKLLTPKKYTAAQNATMSNINSGAFLSIATALQGLLDYRPQRFKILQDLCLERINIFIEFMKEWEKEDRIQNPDKYFATPYSNPEPKPQKTPQNNTPPAPKNNNDGIVYFIVFVLIFILIITGNKESSKKSTNKKT